MNVAVSPPGAQPDMERVRSLIWSDPQIGAMVPDENVAAAAAAPGLSYYQVLQIIFDGYADRPALGLRRYEIRSDAGSGRKVRRYLPAYAMTTYAQMGQKIRAIAAAWQNDPRHGVRVGEYVALLAFTGGEMAMVDFACAYARTISVPLQANLPAMDMMAILEDVCPAVIVASIDQLESACGYALQLPSVRSLVVIDADLDDQSEGEAVQAAHDRLKASGERIALTTFNALVESGLSHSWSPPPRSAGDTQAPHMLMYTSGSTGSPKGALIHEAITMQFWTEIPQQIPTVSIAYAPLNHFMGRIQIYVPLAQGGTAYFSLRHDLSTLLEDIRLARPTYIQFMSRFAESIYQHYLSEVQRRVSSGEDRAQADQEVRNEMSRHYLGDRVIMGVIGGSTIAPEVRQFIAECFDIPFANAFGSTESGASAIAINGQVNRRCVIDYKLRDVPELGYYATDKPFPRGEILVKMTHQVHGYFRRPEASSALFDSDGYLITGDICEETGPDRIEWLDRRNNVIKLAQAEFVAIGPLETQYLADNILVRQMYLYGTSSRAFLLAVVVPDIGYAESKLGRTATDEDLRVLVLEQLQATARAKEFKSFEVPRDVIIERDPFSLENGLLSSVRKPLRPNLRKRYTARLDALYDAIDLKQQQQLAQLRSDGAAASVRDRVAGAFKANLGLSTVGNEDPQAFRDLGGDSLGAVALSALLEEMTGVTVPVGMILGRHGNVQRIAAYIEQALSAGPNRQRFSTIHPNAAVEVLASELTLDRIFDGDMLNGAARAGAPSEGIRVVLLTGATGFLGRFLCLQWLEWLAALGGTLFCVIRAEDDSAAYGRLEEAIGALDPELTMHFASLAARHLRVCAGDLSLPRLGLSEQTFADLADSVDRIVHPAALVNHVLSYQSLFEPNVIGTAELIRLALTGRKKPFEYISTVGVPYLNADFAAAPENTDPRDGASHAPFSNEYAAGYGTSKWAGEVLLRDAYEKFGLPVKVYRPNMILAHSRFRGQINVPDMFTRLLFSVVQTGLAPASFYELPEAGQRAVTHYDGLPVDFLALVMQQIGCRAYSGYETYNIVNTNYDDGISLDKIIDWVVSAGYKVDRINDHAEWYRRFAEKLRQLPDGQRQQSSLEISHGLARQQTVSNEHLRTENMAAALHGCGIGTRTVQLGESFVHKCLHDMKLLNLINNPNR